MVYFSCDNFLFCPEFTLFVVVHLVALDPKQDMTAFGFFDSYVFAPVADKARAIAVELALVLH